MSQVTHILNAIREGDPQVAQGLLPLVYEELRQLAAQKMKREQPGHSLQPTALVHEAYLRLVGDGGQQHWDSRGHFFAAAAEAMRRILVESARRKLSLKRGGELERQPLEDIPISSPLPLEDLLTLEEALTRFAVKDPLKARLVELRYFAGLTLKETAEILGLAPTTADRYWAYARAWLHREITSTQ